MANIGSIVAIWLLVTNLGSEDYKTRADAERRLKVMPWAEPVLLANMHANLEMNIRAKRIIAYWGTVEPGSGPKPGIYAVDAREHFLVGIIDEPAKGPRVKFVWHDWDGFKLRRNELLIDWRRVKLAEVKNGTSIEQAIAVLLEYPQAVLTDSDLASVKRFTPP